jgi:predicted  nucleic acid-binding Zn-ribbon protein
MYTRISYIAFHIALLTFCSPVTGHGQPASSEKPATQEVSILQSLLEELRLLRRDIRRTAVLQATLAQAHSAQSNVESISRALQTTTLRIDQIKEQIALTESDLKSEEEALNQEDNADQRRFFERNIESIRKRLNDLPTEAQKLGVREKELNEELVAAQRRFETINRRLDELLHQLDVP